MVVTTKAQQKKQLGEKAAEKKNKLQVQQDKQQKKQQQSKQDKQKSTKTRNVVAQQSKKIKKAPLIKATEKKQEKIDGLIENYSEFVKQESAKYEKIKQNTMNMIKIDKELVKTAVKALQKYHENNKKDNQLLDSNDDFVYLEIVLSKVPEKYSIRPIQIPLPVPIYGEEYNSRFCIFSRDPQREFKNKIQDLEIPQIAKVQGYKKIPQKFPTHKDKHQLLYSYEQFFCDYKVYSLLRKPLGKLFYERKRFPFPIDCDKVPEYLKEKVGDNYQNYLNDLKNYTYFQMGNGPVYTIKIGREKMDVKDLVKNIINGAYSTIPHILKQKIDNASVRSISIKTYNSLSLPIYNQLSKEELAQAKVSK